MASNAPFEQALGAVLSETGLDAPPESVERMVSHFRLLEKWNRGLNLTRVVAPEEAARRHFGESLLLAQAIGEFGTLADIGSGGGFPGLPIAAGSPEGQVTLIESVGKKAAFLREVSRDWGNVRVEAKRAEQISGPFDWVTMRAVKVAPLLQHVGELAPKLGLLAGEETIEELQTTAGWAWEPPVALPWGDHRFILIGKRST